MNAEIQWLAHLIVERNLVERDACVAIGRDLGPEAELIQYAQQLLERGHWKDVNSLQDLINDVWERAQESAPPTNLFAAAATPKVPASSTVATPSPAQPVSSVEIDHFSSVTADKAGAFMRGLLRKCAAMGASDLHLSANARPFVRLNREVQYLSQTLLSASQSRLLNVSLLDATKRTRFEETQDLDYALSFEGSERFRVNLMVHKDGCAGTYRLVPAAVRPLDKLGFENVELLKKLLSYPNGLILVTGPVGAGKTATLAAMVDELNRTRDDHLISVEAPIEVVQQSRECQITQREVGPHTRTFKSALKGALRQDPDIIVIGEMRDLETIEMAISASETGHLVIGTLHTRDAANTLNRLLDVFPAAQQTQIRSMVSESLRGILCQRLLPTVDGGLTLAYELLVNNPAVGNLIRENKPEGLVNVMETGSSEGMRLMDRSIHDLWKQGRISTEVALINIRSKMLRQQIEASGGLG